MREKLSLGLVAVGCVAFLATSVMGGSVVFSDIGTVGGGVVPGDLDMYVDPGSMGTLYIWSTDDQDYDTTIGMNVVSSDPTAIALTGGAVDNPNVQSQLVPSIMEPRWQDVSVGDITPGQVSNMNASRGTVGTGILAANDGHTDALQNLDLGYDVDAGAFLLGSIEWQAGDVEGSDSVLSINQDGTELFVNADEQVFPEFMTATVTVRPDDPFPPHPTPIMPTRQESNVLTFEDIDMSDPPAMMGDMAGAWFDPPLANCSVRAHRMA